MKAYKNHLLAVLTMLMTMSAPITSFAQNENSGKITPQALVGTWKMDYVASKGKINQGIREKFDSMNADSKAKIENTYKDRILRFEENGAFEMKLRNGRISDGTWKIAPNAKGFLFTNAAGKTQLYYVTDITETTMTLQPKVKDSSKLLFAEWHLVKQ